MFVCYRLARILAARGGSGSAGGTEGVDAREAAAFRRSTLSAYLQGKLYITVHVSNANISIGYFIVHKKRLEFVDFRS